MSLMYVFETTHTKCVASRQQKINTADSTKKAPLQESIRNNKPAKQQPTRSIFYNCSTLSVAVAL